MRILLPVLLSGLLLAPSAFAAPQNATATPAHAQTSTSISTAALDSTAGGIARAGWMDAQPVLAKHAMVVSSQHYATEVGLNILKQGGNAVDAAVAVGYALAVVHPCCGNIGGG
ncbi:MAG: gamma-glutamyltransferase, partial [Metallibacterium scheffleri]|uniref:gamma-glutamyltransferase n=1 Tax=Metallibacterium scheffleri TaxID=993689 RepID=UPI0026ECD664